MDIRADDAGVLAAFRVDAVRIGSIVGVVDGKVQQIQVLCEHGVDSPRIAVLHRDAVQTDVLAVGNGDRAGSPCDASGLGILPPVTVLGIAVHNTLAGHDHILHLRDVQQAGKAVQRVALPAGQVILVHLILAGQYTGQDGVVGAVVVTQQHRALFQIKGGVALEEEACGAVAAGRNVHRAAGRAGRKRCLQPGGVVGHAVCRQTVAGGIHKEGLSFGGKGKLQHFALCLYADSICRAGQQGEEGEDVGVARIVNEGAVQQNGKGLCRAEAAVVLQLEHRTAGHGADQG